MDVDPTRVAAATLSLFSGEGWRHLSPRHDPLSAEGARLHGGRFNPAGSFPVLYICRTRPCVVAELQRFGERQAIGVEGLLPRHLYRYEIRLDRVLDLRLITGERCSMDAPVCVRLTGLTLASPPAQPWAETRSSTDSPG